MKKIFILPTFLLLAVSGTSQAQEGRIPENERNRLVTQIRTIRMTADAEARDCFQANRSDVARILVEVSTQSSSLSNMVSRRGLTWGGYYDAILNPGGLNQLRTRLFPHRDYRGCEPSRVRHELDEVLGMIQGEMHTGG